MMSQTINRQAAENGFHKAVRENSQWALVAIECMEKLNQGYFSGWYKDMVFQNPYSANTTDAYLFAQIHAFLSEERWTITKVPIGCGPYSDIETKANNDALLKLPEGYDARFVGGRGPNDGSVIVGPPVIPDLQEPQYFPLEVGYTQPETTFFHLRMGNKRLARWPYFSEFLYLIY